MQELAAVQQRVGEHYTRGTRGDVLGALLAVLQEQGKDVDALQYADLGGLDHFHGGALAATRTLARLGGLAPGEAVLDAGGGFGGPARTLAAEFGCRVTVLDPTEPFIRAGEALTARVGLQEAVTFRVGSATALPFPDASFDVAWTQNAGMNIADKITWAAELHRVLRPGGRLVFQEVFRGPGGEPHYPLPWAREAALSFLVAPERMRAILRDTGFVERLWEDWSAESAAARREQVAAGPVGPTAARVMHGADAAQMNANGVRSDEEARLAYVRAVLARVSGV
jgi:ubiquinone/menaquinone biosynthesis C-methylase UbiE